MKSFGVCVGLILGLGSLPVLAAPTFEMAQATPAAPAPATPAPAAAPAPSAAPAAAAAPVKPKVKAAAKAKPGSPLKTPSVITIENKSASRLKTLQISLADQQGKVVGKLGKSIAAGKSARVTLKGAKGCEYNVKWELEDTGAEATAHLCGDPKIVVTDE
jgi:nucleoid-associated protein YgaU